MAAPPFFELTYRTVLWGTWGWRGGHLMRIGTGGHHLQPSHLHRERSCADVHIDPLRCEHEPANSSLSSAARPSARVCMIPTFWLISKCQWRSSCQHKAGTPLKMRRKGNYHRRAENSPPSPEVSYRSFKSFYLFKFIFNNNRDIWGPSNFQSFPSVLCRCANLCPSNQLPPLCGNTSFGPKAGPDQPRSSFPSEALSRVQQHQKTTKISRNMGKNKEFKFNLARFRTWYFSFILKKQFCHY